MSSVLSGAPTGTQTLFFFPAAKKKTPVFTVGRFQVTPSLATPPQPRHLWQAAPTAHSPPPQTPSESKSSGSSSASDSSICTTLGFLGDQREREEQQGEGAGGPARRTGIGVWEGQDSSHAGSQSRSRTVPTASSDESESENEEWEELQQLRER